MCRLTILFALTVAAAAVVDAHDCVHDHLLSLPHYRPPERLNLSYHGYSREFRTMATFESMRITAVFDPGDCAAGTCGHCGKASDTVTTYQGSSVICGDDDVLTSVKKDYVMNVLMPKAIAFLGNALKVVRVSGNLIVGGSSTCGSNPGVPIPSAHSSTGVASTDFLIYVTAAPMPSSSSATVAWALACRQDSNSRAVVGHVNWVPRRLTNAADRKTVQQDEDVKTGVHEISHALGFASPFFDSKGYLNLDGTTYTAGGGKTSATTDSTLGKTVTKINSPRVVREARAYFSCDTLNGVEIEDQGGSGTAGSHWEKRILYQEYMAGVGSTVATWYSKMTLAFFEDTGHYQADYSYASTEMSWGKAKGCAFLGEKCNSDTNKASGEFCFETDATVRLCTYDRLGMGACDVGTYSSAVPTNMQYFTTATLGARVSAGDYCPAVVPYSNTICIDSTTSDSQDIYGNTYGSTSLCFVSTLLKSSYKYSSTPSARCFTYTCATGSLGTTILQVYVKGTRVLCPTDGKAGNADVSTLSGYNGYITCPAAAVLCTTATPAPPTPAPTPLPPGETYAPTTTAPTPTTATCAVRASSASLLPTIIPACRRLRDQVITTFGTDCDTELFSYLATLGVDAKCKTRSTFAAECMEGESGVAHLCGLYGSASALSITLAVVTLLLAVVQVVF